MDTMKVRTVWTALVCVGLLILGVRQGTAQDKKDGNDIAAALAKYGTPGPEHKALEPLVGNWDCKVKFWTGPGKAEESTGTAKREWILGNRYIAEHYKGTAFGQPFEGMGVTGYDRFKKKYTAGWVDSMSTSIMTSYGTYDPATKTFTYTGEEDDPISGMKMKTRDTLKIIDNNKHVLEMYRQGQQGPEMKVMEITCTRTTK
jgi:hypothetical protein